MSEIIEVESSIYHLTQTERALVFDLTNNGMVSVRTKANASNKRVTNYLRNPIRVNRFFREMFDAHIIHFKDCLLLVINRKPLSTFDTAVCLTCIQSVINHNTTNQKIDYDGLLQAINNTLLHKQLIESDSAETHNRIAKCLKDLLVDQFHVLDLTTLTSRNSTQPLQKDYWVYNSTFFNFAHILVQYLNTEPSKSISDKTSFTQINELLLTHYSIDRDTDPNLWQFAQQNRALFAKHWSEFPFLKLEMTNDYALLLNINNQQSQARETIIAINVSHQITMQGVTEAQLHQLITKESTRLFPQIDVAGYRNKTLSKLNNMHLIKQIGDFYVPTTIVQRFATPNLKINDTQLHHGKQGN